VGWWDEQDFVRWSGKGSGHFVLRCGGTVCQIEPPERDNGVSDAFRFDLALPYAPSAVALTDVSPPGSARLITMPSIQNGHITRVAVDLPTEGVYAMTLVWTPARTD
jgi:hypothetical protein